MPDLPEDEDFLVILPRPQISVYVNSDLDVAISVTGVSHDNQRVENDVVTFPSECAREVGEALLKIAEKHAK